MKIFIFTRRSIITQITMNIPGSIREISHGVLEGTLYSTLHQILHYYCIKGTDERLKSTIRKYNLH